MTAPERTPGRPRHESYLARVERFLTHDLWRTEIDPGTWPARLRSLLQFFVMVGEGFLRDRLLLRASALTFMTALSVVPLLAVAVSIASVFLGEQDLAALAVDKLLAQIPAAREQILALVQNVNFRGLGPVGAAFLVITTILAVRHAELALGEIWGVQQGRSWMRRFTDYLAVIVVAPILTTVALSLATAFQSEPLVQRLLGLPLFSQLYELGLRWSPVLVYAIAFSFLYWFLPNTTVRIRSALVGGAVAAVLFAVAQNVFVAFVVGSARYSAVFGGFAALPLLLLWIYYSWAVVLLGAEVSFAFQNLPRYRREAAAGQTSPAEREALGLQLALEVGRSFRAGQPPPDAEELGEVLDAPVRAVRDLLQRLESAHVVVRLAQDQDRESGYHPARPLDALRVGQVLRAIHGVREPRSGADAASRRVAAQVLDEIESAQAEAGLDRTLAELLERASSESPKSKSAKSAKSPKSPKSEGEA